MARAFLSGTIERGTAFVKRNAYAFGFSQGERGIPPKEKPDDVPWWCRPEYRAGHADGVRVMRNREAFIEAQA